MELEQLRIFCTVAACRSFTRAAKQLFVSHSTTSRAVSARRAYGRGDGPGAARTAGSVILADCTNFFVKFLRLSEKPS